MALKQLTSQVNFAKGLNVSATKYDIQDTQSPDMSNMVCDLNGASFKRLGTSRFNSQVITQAGAIQGLFRAYKSDQTTKMMLINSGTALYKATDAGVLTSIKGSLTAGFMNFCMMNDLVICTNYTETPFSFNLNATCTDLSGTPPKAKYCLVHKNYLIMGNCNYSATAYPSRIWFSTVLDPDTWGANNFINIRTSDGGVITGLASLHGILYVFKNNSIHAVPGDVFSADPALSDISVSAISDGIGCIAPRSLVTIGGDTAFFLAQDGVRIFNGSSSTVISQDVAPILNAIPAANRANCAAGYDAKNKWYWLSIEDPIKYPDGKLNTILIYDTNTGNWYRIDDLFANIFCSWDGSGDSNQFYYGDAYEGYVNKLNDDLYRDDVALEKPITSMEATETWSADGAADATNYKEGARGIKLTHAASGNKTTASTVALDLNKFLNNIASSESDYIQVKIYHTTRANIETLTLVFDAADCSYTFSGTATTWGLTAGDNQWTTVNILKSAFTKSATPSIAWKGITTVTISHNKDANSTVVVTFDDLRMVKSTRTGIRAYRYTKAWDLKRPEIRKHFIDLHPILADNDFDVDVTGIFNGGRKSKNLSCGRALTEDYVYYKRGASSAIIAIDQVTLAQSTLTPCGDTTGIVFGKDDDFFYVAGTTYVAKYSTRDYTLVSKVTTANGTAFSAVILGVVDDKYIYVPDTIAVAGSNRIVVLKKDDLSYVNSLVVIGTVIARGITVDDKYLYYISNDVLYKVDKQTLEYVASIGSNGTGNDQFNCTGSGCMTCDGKYLYISDRGNARIQKRLKEDLSYVASVAFNGTAGSTLQRSICLDNTYLYISDTYTQYIYKYLKSTLAYIGVSGTLLGDINGIIVHSLKYYQDSISREIPHRIREVANDIQFKFENNNEGEDLKLYKMSIAYIPGALK